MSKVIDLDTKTFIRFWLVILAFAAIFGFIFLAWKGLLVVGAALFLAIAIRPLSEKINGIFLKRKKKNKEQFSSVLAFLIVVFVLLLIVAVIGPVVVSESVKFAGQLPTLFENNLGGWDGVNNIGRNFGIENLQDEIVTNVSDVSSKIVGNLGNTVFDGLGAIGGVLSAAGLSLVLTLLFLLDGPKLYNEFWTKISGKRRDESVEEARRITSKMANVVSTYVAKQVTIAVLDGVVTTLAVFIITLMFGLSPTLAIPMGLITMVFYLIPMFGQIIGCASVSLILLFSNPLAGIIFAVFYIVYAQVENNGIAPKIQGDALRLSPLIVLASITIGVYVAGLLGAIIAIPVAGCIKVLIDEYPRIKEIRELKENKEKKEAI